MSEKQKLLIADDSELNRALLMELLGAEYDYLEAENGAETVKLLQSRGDIDLLLLDVWMPEPDGFGVLELMNRFHWIEEVPVIMISVEQDAAFHARAYDLGATDFIQRPFNGAVVRRRVENTLMLYARQKRLTELVGEQVYARSRESGILVDLLSGVLSSHCGVPPDHAARIRSLTGALLRELSRRTERYRLSEEDIARIAAVSAFYDVGKLHVPAELLRRPGALTPEETAAVRAHAVRGAELLDALPVPQDDFLLRTGREICRWHHERWDGGGYPDGLRGDAIPVAAQAVSLADAYIALTEARPWRKACPQKTALAMLRAGDCGAFNPLLLESLDAAVDAAARESAAPDHYRDEADRIAAEALRGRALPLDDRPQRLLEVEREKTNYYAGLVGGIQFEYDIPSRRVTLADRRPGGQGRITVLDMACRGEQTQLLAPEDFAAVHRALLQTTPYAPDCAMEVRLPADGQKSRAAWLTARTLWSRRAPVTRIGAVGCLQELPDSDAPAPAAGGSFSAAMESLSVDPLTGARSRWFLEYGLPENARFDAAAMLDVDRFKAINDTYGHAAGDAALRAAADAVRGALRPGDLIVRTGGDEFLLLFPAIGAEELDALLSSVRAAVAAARTTDWPELRLSVSIGSARGASSLRDALREADRNMYRDKTRSEGRTGT